MPREEGPLRQLRPVCELPPPAHAVVHGKQYGLRQLVEVGIGGGGRPASLRVTVSGWEADLGLTGEPCSDAGRPRRAYTRA